ncbi:MAG: CPBP family intramembrane metalloprotease [Clostridia bacterium]|nr:CPBP family intramembrane metalloprotease [Clostridia bacterium]
MNETEYPLLRCATGGLSYTLTVVFYMVVLLVVSFIIALAGLDSSSDAYLYLSYLVSPIAIVITLVLVFRYRAQGPKDVLKVKCHPKYYVIGLLMIFGLLFSVSYVNDATIKFFELFGYKASEATSNLPNLDGWNLLPAIIVVALIPAVCEEFMFRGVIYANAENGAGSVAAVFITGFLFSLYHGSPEQTVYQFICGCCFALLVMRSGAVLPGVIIHFINNALILIFYSCGLVGADGYLELSSTANTVMIVVSAVCFAAALVWLILDRKAVQKKKPGETGKFFIWACVGIVIMAVIWIVALVS